MNAYQRREAQRHAKQQTKAEQRAHDKALRVEAIVREYEQASAAAGTPRTLTHRKGWYYVSKGWYRCLHEADVRRAITEIWARVHEKEIQTNDN